MPQQAKFDWGHLSDSDFENLCYDLLGAMGFAELDWRRGTDRPGRAADQGRDIECTWRRGDADGSELSERWFVQAKKYSGGVPPTELQDAFAWASAERPDVLLIATNSFLTNPAKQWIDRYRSRNSPSFRIRYWERPKVEDLLSRYPQVQKKYFPETDPLTLVWEGALDDFRNYLLLASDDRLQMFWDGFDKLHVNEGGRYFLARSEFAMGDLEKRRWLTKFTEAETLTLLVDALLVAPMELQLGAQLGRPWAERTTLAGHIVRHLAVTGTPPNEIAARLWEPLRYVPGTPDPSRAELLTRFYRESGALVYFALQPVLEAAVDACSRGCQRSLIAEGPDKRRTLINKLEGECRINVRMGAQTTTDERQITCPASFLLFACTSGGGYVARDAFAPGEPPETIQIPIQPTERLLQTVVAACQQIILRNDQLAAGGPAEFPLYRVPLRDDDPEDVTIRVAPTGHHPPSAAAPGPLPLSRQ